MKFTIHADLEQEEKEVSSAISEFIKGDVQKQIEKALKNKLKVVDQEINDQIDVVLNKTVRTCIATVVNDAKFQVKLKGLVDSCFKELQERYDMNFATQVVLKLRENNMLNEEGAKLLINEK